MLTTLSDCGDTIERWVKVQRRGGRGVGGGSVKIKLKIK